ncbi:MAG: DUF6231 family protein [Thiobacillus sp.]
MNWREHLQVRLLDVQPASVYALDEAAHHLAASVLPTASVYLPDRPLDAPCTLALGIDALNRLDAPHALHLLNRTRLYAAPRILLATQHTGPLDAEAFRALGFMLSTDDINAQVRVYAYDLDTYKTVPDWLNARYWAHPERWEP